MSVFQKHFRSVDAPLITILSAEGSLYIDLGVIPRSGVSLSQIVVGGTQRGVWEFRYNYIDGVDTGDDANTDEWGPQSVSLLNFANSVTNINFATNNTIASLDINGDGIKKAWLKLTNTGGSAGDFFYSIGVGAGYAQL